MFDFLSNIGDPIVYHLLKCMIFCYLSWIRNSNSCFEQEYLMISVILKEFHGFRQEELDLILEGSYVYENK